MSDHESIYQTLHEIYQKHRRHHENVDSKQMCCMWSTDDPPDIIEGTEPLADIEAAFGITIDDEEALNLYDMDLEGAVFRIMELQKEE
jgi:hypothetical protein